MQRFGGPWGAIKCDEIETPVGELCVRCKVPIKEGDQGVVMPLMVNLGTWIPVAEHRECVLESILGPNWRQATGEQ